MQLYASFIRFAGGITAFIQLIGWISLRMWLRSGNSCTGAVIFQPRDKFVDDVK
ncbi:hypothetical protein GCM10010913_48430 [Paenibacillus aceti]|uniref:Uncharacterized protein n=1 Tax=Paenibacillus aceti TaxID=1820010 RepID=A0ABQ1W9L9_9BACL|nr:hypothetical protein GCM10010913_48430 [Paenibacillus aceti]